jgi:hypothetical protein
MTGSGVKLTGSAAVFLPISVDMGAAACMLGKSKRQQERPEMNTDQLIEAIAAATNENDHTFAVVLLAQAFGCPEEIEVALGIQREHEFHGYMPAHLSGERNVLSTILMGEAEARLGTYDFARLRRAF